VFAKLGRSYGERLAWAAVAAGAGYVAMIATKHALDAAWRVARQQDPPLNPDSPDTSWTEALAWTAATGMAAGVSHLLARRGAMSGWRKVTGSWPPGFRQRDAAAEVA
jgi:hypothetical protein